MFRTSRDAIESLELEVLALLFVVVYIGTSFVFDYVPCGGLETRNAADICPETVPRSNLVADISTMIGKIILKLLLYLVDGVGPSTIGASREMIS